jgi:hypothetical protein
VLVVNVFPRAGVGFRVPRSLPEATVAKKSQSALQLLMESNV